MLCIFLISTCVLLLQDNGVAANGDYKAPDAHVFWEAGLNGTNQVVGIGDSGIDMHSCFFRDPNVPFNPPSDASTDAWSAPTHRKVIYYWGLADPNYKDLVGHGTHTSGSIVGQDPSDPLNKATGAAHGAKLAFVDLSRTANGDVNAPQDLAKDYYPRLYERGARVFSGEYQAGLPQQHSVKTCSNSIVVTDTKCAGWCISTAVCAYLKDSLPCARTLTFWAALSAAVCCLFLPAPQLGTSDSWGSANAAYDFQSSRADAWLYTHQDTICHFAAGNYGENDNLDTTITSPATAKNVVTVGATKSLTPNYLSQTIAPVFTMSIEVTRSNKAAQYISVRLVKADFGGDGASLRGKGLNVVQAMPPNACGTLTDAAGGKYQNAIVLAKRGTCFFSDKMAAGTAAGAAAVVVINDRYAHIQLRLSMHTQVNRAAHGKTHCRNCAQ